jgi:hypothetical protein
LFSETGEVKYNEEAGGMNGGEQENERREQKRRKVICVRGRVESMGTNALNR